VTARCQFPRCPDDVLVRVRMRADKKSGDTDLLATWAAVKIVQAGHHVHGTRSKSGQESGTLHCGSRKVAKSRAVTATSWATPCGLDRNYGTHPGRRVFPTGPGAPVCGHALLGVRDWRKQERQYQPATVFKFPQILLDPESRPFGEETAATPHG